MKKTNSSLAFLFLLLVIRFVDANLPIWFGFNKTEEFDALYRVGVYMAVALVLWLNKNNLYLLNIDTIFVKIFIASGVLLSLIYTPLWIAAFPLITAFYIFKCCHKPNSGVEPKEQDNKSIVTLIAISLLPSLFASWYNNRGSGITIEQIISALIGSELHLVIFEEVLFRSMLWSTLKALELSERNVVLITSLMFWFAHYALISHIYTFWFSLPLVGLIYGILVSRSKSISPSIIAHYLFNVLALLAT